VVLGVRERWSYYLTQWNEMQNVLNVCHGYMLICSFCLLQGLQCLSLPCLWFGGDGRFLSVTLECILPSLSIGGDGRFLSVTLECILPSLSFGGDGRFLSVTLECILKNANIGSIIYQEFYHSIH
jgi:hypothetical protein